MLRRARPQGVFEPGAILSELQPLAPIRVQRVVRLQPVPVHRQVRVHADEFPRCPRRHRGPGGGEASVLVPGDLMLYAEKLG